MSISWQAIYPRLKGYLAKRAGFDDWRDIEASMSLSGHPLHYRPEAKSGLAGVLNDLFEKPPRTHDIAPQQTASAASVRKLAALVKEAHR